MPDRSHRPRGLFFLAICLPWITACGVEQLTEVSVSTESPASTSDLSGGPRRSGTSDTLAAVAATPNRDATQAKGQPPLTVMTWNLEWFYDESSQDNYSRLAREQAAPDRASWEWRRDTVAAKLAEVQPTVAAVQEVESRRVLWYLTRALSRDHELEYREYAIEGRDYFTEQDVGLLVRQPAEVVSNTRFDLPRRIRDKDGYRPVSKHLQAVLEFPVDDRVERIRVMTVHFRATPEARDERVRQARTVHAWLGDAIAAGEHVIVLGDLNTEQLGAEAEVGSDLHVLQGRETTSTDDDLYDLHAYLAEGSAFTHPLARRHYDRILVSKSLLEDDPDRRDLAFDSVAVRADLSIRGGLDRSNEHWDRYWEIAPSRRDLSDHAPLVAVFEVR